MSGPLSTRELILRVLFDLSIELLTRALVFLIERAGAATVLFVHVRGGWWLSCRHEDVRGRGGKGCVGKWGYWAFRVVVGKRLQGLHLQLLLHSSQIYNIRSYVLPNKAAGA